MKFWTALTKVFTKEACPAAEAVARVPGGSPYRERPGPAQAFGERKLPELPYAFYATIESVRAETRKGITGYHLLLDVPGIDHAVPAVLLDSREYRKKSNTDFSSLRQGDVIKTCAISSTIEFYTPISILGGVQVQPPGTKAVNEGRVFLGYESEVKDDCIVMRMGRSKPRRA